MAKKRTAKALIRLTLDVEVPLGEVTSLAEAAQTADGRKTIDWITALKLKAPSGGWWNEFDHRLEGVWLD